MAGALFCCFILYRYLKKKTNIFFLCTFLFHHLLSSIASCIAMNVLYKIDTPSPCSIYCCCCQSIFRCICLIYLDYKLMSHWCPICMCWHRETLLLLNTHDDSEGAFKSPLVAYFFEKRGYKLMFLYRNQLRSLHKDTFLVADIFTLMTVVSFKANRKGRIIKISSTKLP